MIFFLPMTRADEWEWMQARAKPVRCEDSQGIVAYNQKGEIAACCVMDSFNADSCNVHLAIDNPLAIKYGFFHEIARHVFITCGRQRIFGLVPADNAKALRLDRKIGFVEVARIPDGYQTGIDYVVFRMDADGCRWLEPIRRAA